MGASVGAVDLVGAVVTGGIAAKVPRTLASMVAWVSGVGLDAPMVGLSLGTLSISTPEPPISNPSNELGQSVGGEVW